ncbi:neutral zinc metallopeptidase [Allorhizocola rhizosphaerae]|uniref:neutral zinc metallopeptidase n=1 Tax=Allorhizocola rhizosphaerae TaxID=1872709 RepID=UPI000E3BCB46|nr:neutral zinc metallopeptidase [Allorhizocola rhizosphaerae]
MFSRLLVTAVATVAVLACFVGPQERDQGGDGGGGSGSRMTAEEFQRDLEGAVATAERYWRARVDGFDPVNDVVPYLRGGEVSCGGQGLPDNNAAYCPAGDFIAYDADWAVAAFRQLGDAFLFYLLGHEYAHAIQVQLGVRHQFTIQAELQADCMAGAYIGDSVRANQLTLEEGDLDELRTGLIAVGDDPDQPWFEQGAHGSPEQRTQAFFNGYEQSLDPCGL